jgi:hypothetical protein
MLRKKNLKILAILVFLVTAFFSQSAFAYGSSRDCRYQSRHHNHNYRHYHHRVDRFDRLGFNTVGASSNGFVLVVNSGRRHSHYVPSYRARIAPVCRFNDC